jgi:hypothetical protein
MTASVSIQDSFTRLQHYIELEKYSGYDPYDGLMSPLFKLPVLKAAKPIRFLAQQFVKRSALNLRPILGIKKSINPVTLGLCIQGYWASNVNSKNDAVCLQLISQLIKLQSKGFHGTCWGYNFDWEARYARIPAFQPTVVATGIITNALYRYYKNSHNQLAKELITGAAQFVANDLNRTEDSFGNICFSYSPFDTQQVFNASLKGARILAQAGSINNNETFRDLALKAARFVTRHQQPNGAWIYAAAKGKWTDNYHTGYVLDCLHEIAELTGTDEFNPAIHAGFAYYKSNFFEADGLPKFYDVEPFPVDCTAAAQSILTLLRFEEVKLAEKVAFFMIEKMQAPAGNFYFRKFRSHTEKTSFMRWSNAWMFAALGELSGHKTNG